MRRSASFDELQTGGIDELQTDGFDELHTSGFDEQAIGGVRREAAWGNQRWKRSLLERERDERVTGEIFSKKKDWGDERVTERETEKDERWARIFIILLTGRIKNSFFYFCYQLQCTSIYRCALIDVHCSGTSKFFPYTSTAAACLLSMWS